MTSKIDAPKLVQVYRNFSSDIQILSRRISKRSAHSANQTIIDADYFESRLPLIVHMRTTDSLENYRNLMFHLVSDTK